MALTTTEVKKKLTKLLLVTVDNPQWSQTQLLNLPIVKRQFEISERFGIGPDQANLNLAICLLQCINQLTPVSAATRFYDTWRMLIGAEMNCFGEIRGYVASALPTTRVSDSMKNVLEACAGQTSYSAKDIEALNASGIKNMVQGAITTIWLWKTGTSPLEKPTEEWNALLNKSSGERMWTHDITFKQRKNLIAKLAEQLISKQAQLQPIGLGPQVFEEIGGQQIGAAPTIESKLHTIIASDISKAKPVSPPAPIQIDVVAQPVIDTLDLYLNHVLPPVPRYIPAEWHELIAAAASSPRTIIQGGVGSGKTNLLLAIAHDLKRMGQVPLYLDVSNYAHYAEEMDIFEFVATKGDFWQAYRDRELSQEFVKTLAEAQRVNRLIVIADQCDDLFEHEWSTVSRSLNGFQRLVIAERAPRLGVDRTDMAMFDMPALPIPALLGLMESSGQPDLAESKLIELQQQGIELSPGIAKVAADMIPTVSDLHPAAIVGAWIDKLLKRARSTNTLVAEIDKAQLVLQKLSEETKNLTRDQVFQFFSDPILQLKDRDEGRRLLDLCARAGLVVRDQESWRLANHAFTLFFAARYAIRNCRVSLSPRDRKIMAWRTAMLVRRGSSREQEAFFATLKSALDQSTDLSALEAVDILGEAGFGLPAAAKFEQETLRRLRDLAKIESEAVGYAVQEKAQRYALNVGLTRKYDPPDQLIPENVLDDYACDLPALLQQIGLKRPRGSEDNWLENSNVLNGLIQAMRTQSLPTQYQCAGWLRRSPLSSPFPLLRVEERSWGALEMLAKIASDPAEDTVTRVLAKSVLAKDEFVLQLANSCAEYIPLVYELLLAMDKRLVGQMASPYSREWRVYG